MTLPVNTLPGIPTKQKFSPHNYYFDDATDRAAGIESDRGAIAFTAEDVAKRKVALQLDDNTEWRITNHSPLEWTAIKADGAVSTGELTTALAAKLDAARVNNDTTMADDSTTDVPTQHAAKTYTDDAIAQEVSARNAAIAAALAANDALLFKGIIDCSANPNYPAADAGFVYKVSVAGKIGGASGVIVEIGDMLTCCVDSSASGNQATVGANWFISQTNIDGAVTGPASATDGNAVVFDGPSGKLVKDAGFAPARASRTINGYDLTADRALKNDDLSVHGADVASAGTLNLDTATGDDVNVTGTTTITAITLTEGRKRKVRFTGVLTLTHNSSIILPSGASITTAAGDWAEFVGRAGGVVYCSFYTRASGQPLVGGSVTLDSLTVHGADVASNATVNLDTATGDLVDVTGTTTITAITLSEGRCRTVRFTGVLTLTHGASLVLPGAANIATAIGDYAIFRGYAAGVVRCVSYTRASGAGETTATIGALINGATAKTTPVDADMVGLMDSAATNVLKKLSWLNIKATLKTYFDTLYATLAGVGGPLIDDIDAFLPVSLATLSYVSDGDSNGLFYWLGTARGTTGWSNPHTAGSLVVSSPNSSWGSGSPATAVDRVTGQYSYLNGVGSTSIMFDLVNCALQPSKYSIRNANGGGVNWVNWQFWGTNTTFANRTIIENVTGGNIADNTWASRAIAGAGIYRYLGFTIVSNGNGDNYLRYSEFELYGEVFASAPTGAGPMEFTGDGAHVRTAPTTILTMTGNQDNVATTHANTLVMNNASGVTIRGISASDAYDGKPLSIISIGAGSVTINHQDANSTAANRIITSTGAALVATAGTGRIDLIYDATTQRWRAWLR